MSGNDQPNVSLTNPDYSLFYESLCAISNNMIHLYYLRSNLEAPQEENMSVDREINVVGKACPMPLIALAKEVRSLTQGQCVRIIGNDPIFEESIVEFCRGRRHEVIETTRDGKTVSIVIKV
jgi:TusA-related sulfurtransferase